eukprot:350677-Chlamydomonas_euryale.AAC.4
MCGELLEVPQGNDCYSRCVCVSCTGHIQALLTAAISPSPPFPPFPPALTSTHMPSACALWLHLHADRTEMHGTDEIPSLKTLLSLLPPPPHCPLPQTMTVTLTLAF